jgi:AcrR family transcriptional regulator
MRDDSSRRSPGRPRHPIPRSQLLSIAREVFAASGYEGASLSEIARRAGVRKASLFHHFPNKLALYLEAVHEMVLDLRAHIEEAAARPGSLAGRLDRLGEAVVRYLGTHRHAARLLLRELVDDGPFLRSPAAAAVMATLDATVALLAEGTAGDARLHPRAARHRALSIIGLHLFYFAAEELSSKTLGEDIHSAEAVAERVQAVTYHVRRIAGEPAPRRRSA